MTHHQKSNLLVVFYFVYTYQRKRVDLFSYNRNYMYQCVRVHTNTLIQ